MVLYLKGNNRYLRSRDRAKFDLIFEWFYSVGRGHDPSWPDGTNLWRRRPTPMAALFRTTLRGYCDWSRPIWSGAANETHFGGCLIWEVAFFCRRFKNRFPNIDDSLLNSNNVF